MSRTVFIASKGNSSRGKAYASALGMLQWKIWSFETVEYKDLFQLLSFIFGLFLIQPQILGLKRQAIAISVFLSVVFDRECFWVT